MDVAGHWRKVPERDSTDFLMLSWKAQGLYALLWRKVDRGGVLGLGRHGLRGVCAHVGSPKDWPELEPLLKELIDAGELEWTPEAGALRIPIYEEAQDAMSESPEALARRRRREAEREKKRVGGTTNDPDMSGHVRTKADTSESVRSVADAPTIDRQTDKTEETRQKDNPQTPKGAESQGDLPGLPAGKPKDAPSSTKKADPIRSTAQVLLAEYSAARLAVDRTCRPLDPVPANLHEIEGRLREKHTAEQIRHVIRVVTLRARHDSLTRDHMNAVTPFRKSKFGRWLAMSEAEARKPSSGSSHPPGMIGTTEAVLRARDDDAYYKSPEYQQQLSEELNGDN